MKKSVIGEGSKVPHLSYIGDSKIGKHSNIGAGTITCNYDGVHKHPTIMAIGYLSAAIPYSSRLSKSAMARTSPLARPLRKTSRRTRLALRVAASPPSPVGPQRSAAKRLVRTIQRNLRREKARAKKSRSRRKR